MLCNVYMSQLNIFMLMVKRMFSAAYSSKRWNNGTCESCDNVLKKNKLFGVSSWHMK